MVKNVSAPMLSHLAGDATTLARCCKITRNDGEIFAFTGVDINIPLPDNIPTIYQVANNGGVFSGATFNVPLPNDPVPGDLLIAFVNGITAANQVNTAAWTVAASDYTDGYGFVILYRYVQSDDDADLPLITTSNFGSLVAISATVQEVQNVTGNPSIDIASTSIVHAFEPTHNNITSGALTVSDPFTFALFGSSSDAFDFNTSAPTFSSVQGDGLQITDVSAPPVVSPAQKFGYGCGHQLVYGSTVQVEATYTSGSQFDYFIGLVVMGVDSLTYSPVQGFSPTAIESKDDMSVDNMEVQGIFNSESITIADLRAGKFDFATFEMFVVNYNDITQGQINLRTGNFGEVVSSPQGWFKVELRGMTQLLQQLIIELYGPECRADLGDFRCTVPIDPPIWEALHSYNTAVNQVNTNAFIKGHVSGSFTDYRQYGNVIFQCTTAGQSGSTEPTWNATVGATTSDGTVVWTCVGAWTRTGQIASIIDPINFTVTWDAEDSRDVDTWYQYGIMQFDTGNNAGESIDVKAWVQLAEQMTTYVTLGYPAQVGDRFHVTPGCDKSVSTCKDKFDNVLNMRAEPYLPGNDFVFFYPNASGGGVQAA